MVSYLLASRKLRGFQGGWNGVSTCNFAILFLEDLQGQIPPKSPN